MRPLGVIASTSPWVSPHITCVPIRRFDNLFPVQIATLLDSVLPSIPADGLDAARMQDVASCIAHTAHKSAKGTKNVTPFAEAAIKAGYQYKGGKMDDITVVTSLVAGSE